MCFQWSFQHATYPTWFRHVLIVCVKYNYSNLFFYHELWLNQFSQNRLIFKYLTMKFIRAGVIQFDLFPRNCELTSAFENSASLLGKSTLCHTVLTRRKKSCFFIPPGRHCSFFFSFLIELSALVLSNLVS